MHLSHLQRVLKRFDTSIIVSLMVDLAAHQIRIMLKTRGISPSAEWSEHVITFEGVRSFTFIDNANHSEAPGWNDDEGGWDYVELTGIAYIKHLGALSCSFERDGDIWKDQAQVNFVIEVWSSSLYVGAKRIRIDDMLFDVE